VRLGFPICEDIWFPDVVACLHETGAEILIVPNGSPFDWKKPDVRMNVAVARVAEAACAAKYGPCERWIEVLLDQGRTDEALAVRVGKCEAGLEQLCFDAVPAFKQAARTLTLKMQNAQCRLGTVSDCLWGTTTDFDLSKALRLRCGTRGEEDPHHQAFCVEARKQTVRLFKGGPGLRKRKLEGIDTRLCALGDKRACRRVPKRKK